MSLSSECCACNAQGGWLRVSVCACKSLSIVLYECMIHPVSVCVAITCSVCGSSLLILCVCVRVCSNKTIPDDKQAGNDCNAVSRSCAKRRLRYICSVRHHELDVIYAPGQDSPFEIRGLLHQNVEVRNQEWVAVDDLTQTIVRGCGDVVCSRSHINRWLWDALQIRSRNFHLTLF